MSGIFKALLYFIKFIIHLVVSGKERLPGERKPLWLKLAPVVLFFFTVITIFVVPEIEEHLEQDRRTIEAMAKIQSHADELQSQVNQFHSVLKVAVDTAVHEENEEQLELKSELKDTQRDLETLQDKVTSERERYRGILSDEREQHAQLRQRYVNLQEVRERQSKLNMELVAKLEEESKKVRDLRVKLTRFEQAEKAEKAELADVLSALSVGDEYE